MAVLKALHQAGAGFEAGLVPWEAVVDLWRAAGPEDRRALEQKLLEMLDLDYRNPLADFVPGEEGIPGLPAGMQPDDLLCLEAAAFAATHLGLPGVQDRLRALLREPRFHAVYPRLRRLHLELPSLLAGRTGGPAG